MNNPERLASIVKRFPERRVLVLGDVILDRYVWGSVERISPEAPVPVVRVERESTMLGGAGNVARNLASLGAQAEVAATVGDDDAARELLRLCANWKIDAAGLVTDPSRPTTLKTRVIARAQQVVRYDRELEQPIGAGTVDAILDALRAQVSRIDGVIIQDYGKGLLTRAFVEEAMAIFAGRGLRIFVDPKQGDWAAYRGAELVKPNLREAEQVAGIHATGEAGFERLGEALLRLTGAGSVAITRGDEGMSLFSSEAGLQHVPTVARAVADVAGAGDTAIATLALARLSGASWIEAAQLANAAAGFVVGVPGTATLTPGELLAALGADS
jgi:D-beta-D-heptose 7-phosphate kinase/D-beta-D-heptose 1-phosphate adenosyltransferase